MTFTEADHSFLAGLTVLYVEDDYLIRNAASEFLRRRVGRLCVAEDGEAGLAAFRRERPDMVITDIMMPKMDGLAMTEVIKAEAPGLPVVVTTAFEQAPFLLRSIQLGVDRYVVKPVQSELFEAALLHCAHQLRAEAELRQHLRVERELMLSRHHESMSILAKGMAHDYNNLLQAILSSVEAAVGHTPPGSPAHLVLGMTQRYAAKAQQLGQHLLALSKETDKPDQEGSPLALIQASLHELLEGTGITVAMEVPADLPAIRFNQQRLSQALSVLVTNAREAMPGGGTLDVAAVSFQVGPDMVELGLSPGTYLRLNLKDSGSGITAEHLPRVFDPYFSTKPMGAQKGQGLGLAVCRSILRAHGGQVTAESVVGQGSTFSVFLPVVLARTAGS